MRPQPDFIHEFVPGSSERTLLLLHGTGGNERDLIPLGRELDPNAALLSPRGKVLENGMPRFFRRLAEGVFDLEDLKYRTHELADFVTAAAQHYGFASDNVVAVGYSNGANIAASMLLLLPEILSATILFRAMVPLVPETQPNLSAVRVWIGAGTYDPIIPTAETKRLAELLRGAGADVTMRYFQGKPDHQIESLLLDRWSPRAMSGEEISREELMRLFEAARWAPSSFNAQQWRALYARRGTEHWQTFFDLLVDANKVWAKNAAVLVVFISRKFFDHNDEPSVTHSYDAGAAWENFALQGFHQGLVVHGMEGFDYERARKELRIPDEFQVEAMAAVGKPGRKEWLPEKLQARESPNDRRKLSDSIFEGPFRSR